MNTAIRLSLIRERGILLSLYLEEGDSTFFFKYSNATLEGVVGESGLARSFCICRYRKPILSPFKWKATRDVDNKQAETAIRFIEISTGGSSTVPLPPTFIPLKTGPGPRFVTFVKTDVRHEKKKKKKKERYWEIGLTDPWRSKKSKTKRRKRDEISGRK